MPDDSARHGDQTTPDESAVPDGQAANLTVPSPTTDTSQEPGARSRRARAARAARRIYLLALGAAVAWLASTRHEEVVDLLEGTRPGRVAAALAASFGLILLTSALWHAGLRMLGHPVALHQAVLATARSLPARYVPLGVTYAAARMALLRAAGVPLVPLAVTAGTEMALSASVALAAGVALLGTAGALPGGAAWTVAAVVAAVAAVSPVAGGRAVNRLLARRGAGFAIAWRDYLRMLAAATAYWVWAAGTFVLYLRAFPFADGLAAVEIAGAFMVAWAVGFLTVFAPQGLGVAELGLAAILAAGDQGGVAVAGVYAGYRIVLVARDAVAAGAGELIASRRARRGSGPTG